MEFLTEKKNSLRNVPGVLKRKKKKKFFLGGGGQKFLSFFSLLNFFFQKCSWGSETHANKNLFFGGGGGILGCLGRPTPPPGGRAGSENDTLLPMTMICDRLKFWSGPAWRSKVIIRKPWRRKNKKKKKKKKKKNSDKTIRHSRREAGNNKGPNWTFLTLKITFKINQHR